MFCNSFVPYEKKTRKRYRNEIPRLRNFSPPKNAELKLRHKSQQEKVPSKQQK